MFVVSELFPLVYLVAWSQLFPLLFLLVLLMDDHAGFFSPLPAPSTTPQFHSFCDTLSYLSADLLIDCFMLNVRRQTKRKEEMLDRENKQIKEITEKGRSADRLAFY